MKECSKCNKLKSLTEFYKNLKNKSTGLSSYCKTCQKEDKKIHYQNNKDKYKNKVFENQSKWWLEFKRGLKCSKCGFDHPAALDFHHTDSNKKEFNISNNKNYYKYDSKKLLEEIKKCVVLCANCHRIEHSINYNKTIE